MRAPQLERKEDSLSELATKTCIPCTGDVPPLKGHDLAQSLDKLGNHWRCINQHHLYKKYDFPNFRQALAFTNRVGELAEQQGHHPDIYLAWGKVILTVWTDKIDGLTESDFIFAAKADQELGEQLLREGFRNVHNLKGGIEAWSQTVDSSVPRY